MAVTVVELPDSRQVSGNVITFRFRCEGTNQLEAVADAVLLYIIEAGLFSYGYYRCRWLEKSMDPDPPEAYIVSVPYSLPEIPQITLGTPGPVGSRPSFTLPGETTILGPEWSQDYGETTRKLTKSIKFFGGVDWNGNPWPPPGASDPIDSGADPYVEGGADLVRPRGHAIGLDPITGEVQGADVPDGSMRIQLTMVIPALTIGYQRKLERMRNCVNSELFLSRAVGEVRFAGAQFGFKYADGISGLYQFDVKPNQQNLQISDQIVLPFVRGWDYVEVFYDWALRPEGPVGAVYKKPRYAQVHQVLKYDDLNKLFTP